MVAQTRNTDGFVATAFDAGTSDVFKLMGGKYAVVASAASWGGGNLAMQVLGPDGTTYVACITAITANGFAVYDLPPGTYRFVLTTTNGASFCINKVR